MLSVLATHKQKKTISNLFYLFANLYKYPTPETWEDISSHNLIDELMSYAAEFHGNEKLPEINRNSFRGLEDMQRVYRESLKKMAPPVESIYKIWTVDETCMLPFAKSKGFFLGDSALHIRYILEKLQIEIPEGYASTPDHLAILLELLVYFNEHSEPDYTAQFLSDHFDWIDDFAARLEKLSINHFYYQVTCLLQQMLGDLKVFYNVN